MLVLLVGPTYLFFTLVWTVPQLQRRKLATASATKCAIENCNHQADQTPSPKQKNQHQAITHSSSKHHSTITTHHGDFTETCPRRHQHITERSQKHHQQTNKATPKKDRDKTEKRPRQHQRKAETSPRHHWDKTETSWVNFFPVHARRRAALSM